MTNSPFRAPQPNTVAPGDEPRNGDAVTEQPWPGQRATATEEAGAGRADNAEDVLVSPAPLVRTRPPAPQSGLRRWVHRLSGGTINPGPSATERRILDRDERVMQRMAREFHVTTYLCLKGGIAKTSSAIGVAKTMAEARPDATLLADFNPDAGDAAERTVGETLRGVTQLAAAAERVETVGELYRFLATYGRLVVLPGEPDPRLGDSLSSLQFNAVLEVARRYFANIHLDAGTGITHPSMPGILAATDTVVVPAAYSITGARRAQHTISWLAANGYSRLADSAIVALTESHRVSKAVNRQAVRDLFPRNAVVHVPEDSHVADGAVIDLGQLQPRTRDAYTEIAAQVADQFAQARTA